jgi:hypothetical protein
MSAKPDPRVIGWRELTDDEWMKLEFHPHGEEPVPAGLAFCAWRGCDRRLGTRGAEPFIDCAEAERQRQLRLDQ